MHFAYDSGRSTLCTARALAARAACLWKYHTGMPFCIVTTAVSGPKLWHVTRDRFDLVRLHREDHDVFGRFRRSRVLGANIQRDLARCRRP